MQVRPYELAHPALLFWYGQRSVHDRQVKLIHHCFVLVHDTLLKKLEALGRIVAEAQVHSSLVIFQFRSPGENTAQRHLQGHSVIEGHRRFHRELIELSYPLAINIAGDIASKSCIDVAIRQHNGSCLEWRDDIVLCTVSKIRGMDQAKRCRREQLLFLATARR